MRVPATPRAPRRHPCGAGEVRGHAVGVAPRRLSCRATGAPGARASWLVGLVVVALLELPGGAHASVHGIPASHGAWPGVVAALRSPSSTDEDVVRAARSDARARRLGDREAPIALGRFLAAAVSDPRIRLEAGRGAALLQRFSAQRDAAATFWSEFSLATLQQLAGGHRQVARTLRRALAHAASEGIPAATVTRTAGIMAHAQQAGGLSNEAKAAFQRLREDPREREHAIVHLGELAIAEEGVGIALEIWLSHPGGVASAVTVIVDEADALWARDPDLSYRLVAAAIARLQALSAWPRGPGFANAVARLAARTRGNAMARERPTGRIEPRAPPLE